MSFLTRLLLLLWSVLMTLYMTSSTKAQEPEGFRGIFCDTPTQIESVVARGGTALGGAHHDIQAVNAAEPEARIVATTIIGIRAERLHAIETPNGLLDIAKWEGPILYTTDQGAAGPPMVHRGERYQAGRVMLSFWSLAEFHVSPKTAASVQTRSKTATSADWIDAAVLLRSVLQPA